MAKRNIRILAVILVLAMTAALLADLVGALGNDNAAGEYYLTDVVALAVADIHDLTMGLNELEQGQADAIALWRMARSNLEDVANTLPSTFSHDSVKLRLRTS